MSPHSHFSLTSEVWLYPGMAGWHFLSVSKKESGEIKKRFGALQKGWGSLPVEATIGKTSWRTSIFFDSKSGMYILPLKVQIRKKEEILSGDKVKYKIVVLV